RRGEQLRVGVGQGLVGLVSVSALSEISAKSACADPKMNREWAGVSVPAEPGWIKRWLVRRLTRG
ncbi:hypothetical protein, partial [Micromonospora sp. ATA51]|uniref:hypothetical protein n=1 Tax=Micromonospora sp. ATA51 TaxID=2806098 RepID=UPI001EE4DECE